MIEIVTISTDKNQHTKVFIAEPIYVNLPRQFKGESQSSSLQRVYFIDFRFPRVDFIVWTNPKLHLYR